MGRLKKSSLEKLEAVHEKMLNQGITAEKALKMNAKQWKAAFGGKKLLNKTNLAGAKRNIGSLSLHQKKVLDFKFKKRGITDETWQNTIKERTNQLLRRGGGGGTPEGPEKPKKGEYVITGYKGRTNRVTIKIKDKRIEQYEGLRLNGSEGIRDTKGNLIQDVWVMNLYKMDEMSNYEEIFASI